MLNFENKKNLYTAVIVCCIAVPLILLIVNIDPIASFINSVLSVLSPIILGAAIAYILNPVLKLFEYKVLKKLKKKRTRRALSLLFTYIVAIAVLVGFAFLLIPQLIKSIMDLSTKFESYVAATSEFINNFINKFMGKQNSEYINAESLKNAITKLFSASNNILDTIAEYVQKYGMAIVTFIKNLFLALFISIYMLSSKERLTAQSKKCAKALLKEKNFKTVSKYLRNTNTTFAKFFIGKIVDSLIILGITLVTLLIFRMPYALLVSVIIGVTNIIPVFGPFIGAIPSALIIFIAEPKKALIFIILIIIIQQLDGNVIGPKILGNSTGLSALGVIVAIVIMGAYFGVVGMIVGVPLFAVIVEILKEFIEAKLKAKELSTDTADYYSRGSLVDPHEHHETLSSKIFAKIEKWIIVIKGKIFKGKKKGKAAQKIKEKEEEKSDSNNDESQDK